MENNYKVYKSDKLGAEYASNLSLFFYPDFFLVFAKNYQGKTVAIHRYQNFEWEALSSYFDSDNYLKLDLPANIYIHNPLFTLFPDNYFLSENIQNYMGPISSPTESAHFFSTSLKTENIQILSFIPEKQKKILDKKFSNCQFFHGSMTFLSYLIHEKENQLGKEIIVHYCNTFIYLSGFSNRELLVFNRFDIKSVEDIMKYVLIMNETLKFERDLTRVTIFGATRESGISEELGSKYFSNFRLAKPYSNQNYSSGFDPDDHGDIFEFFWQLD